MNANHFNDPKENWKQIAKRWEECGVGVSKEEVKEGELGNCLLWLDIGPVPTKKSDGAKVTQPVNQVIKAVGAKRIKKEPKKRLERGTRRQNLDHPAQFDYEHLHHSHQHHNTMQMEMGEAAGFEDNSHTYTLHDMDTSMPVLSPHPGEYEPFPSENAPLFDPIITEAQPPSHQDLFSDAFASFPNQNPSHFDASFSRTQPESHQNSFLTAVGPFPDHNAPHFDSFISGTQLESPQNQFLIFDESMVPYVGEEVTIATEENDSKKQALQNDQIPSFLTELGIDLGLYLHDPKSLEPAPQLKKRAGNAYNLYRGQWRKRGNMIPFKRIPDEEKRELENAKVTLNEIQDYQVNEGLIRIYAPRRRVVTAGEESD